MSVVGLVDLGVVEDLLNGFESGAKEVLGRWGYGESQSGRR